MGDEGIVDDRRGLGSATLIDDRDGTVILIAMYDVERGIVGVDRSHALYNTLATRRK